MELDKWIEQLWDCKHLDERQMGMLCSRLIDILIEESNVQVRNAFAALLPLTSCHPVAYPICHSISY
jgi:hypothetical protein